MHTFFVLLLAEVAAGFASESHILRDSVVCAQAADVGMASKLANNNTLFSMASSADISGAMSLLPFPATPWSGFIADSKQAGMSNTPAAMCAIDAMPAFGLAYVRDCLRMPEKPCRPDADRTAGGALAVRF